MQRRKKRQTKQKAGNSPQRHTAAKTIQSFAKSYVKRYTSAKKIQKFMKQYASFKYYTLNDRINYFKYVQNHLKKAFVDKQDQNCLVPKKFVVDAQINEGYTIAGIVNLVEKIGSASVYGDIYKTSIKNMIVSYPIAAKIMEDDEFGGNKEEAKLSLAFSNRIITPAEKKNETKN